MTAHTAAPNDRASFNLAINAILADHATMRRLAAVAARGPHFSADDIMSLADAMTAHEKTEAELFALPFITRPPAAVGASAANAHRRCREYTSGNTRVPEAAAAATLFVDALLAHLEVEDAWLAQEREHESERLRIIA